MDDNKDTQADGRWGVLLMFTRKPTATLTAAETELVMAGKKLDAIKALRLRTALGLAEAKDIVEALESALGRRQRRSSVGEP